MNFHSDCEVCKKLPLNTPEVDKFELHLAYLSLLETADAEGYVDEEKLLEHRNSLPHLTDTQIHYRILTA